MPKRPAAAAPQPLISNTTLQELYATLLRLRALRQHTRARQRTKSVVAAEALVTATVTHLEEGDAVMPLSHDSLAALARGYSLRRVRGGGALPGMLPEVPDAAARFNMAAGFALAHRDKKHVTLAFSGPGIASLEALNASLMYASAHKLGIVFVIETAANTDVSSARHTQRLGLPGIPVDGNDVIAIYRVAQEAISRARRGGGPTLIDCKPWPLGPAVDPVRKLEEALQRRGLNVSRLRERTLAAFQKKLNATPKKKA